MIKVLNETVKRNIDSVMDVYPNCEYIMAIDNIDDEEGYLMAISTEISEYKEFATVMRKYKEGHTDKLYMMCGGYSNDSLHLQYEAEV